MLAEIFKQIGAGPIPWEAYNCCANPVSIICKQYLFSNIGIVSGCDTLFTSYTYLKQRYCTLSPIFEKTVRIGFTSEIFSNNATIPSDNWSVVKKPIAMFEFTTWHASFTDFFIKLRSYTAIWKQLLFANDRNRVRGAVLGLSQDGACTDLFKKLSVNSLKGDLSNATTLKPPLFSLVNTFKRVH